MMNYSINNKKTKSNLKSVSYVIGFTPTYAISAYNH
jgi:hypothetical protein